MDKNTRWLFRIALIFSFMAFRSLGPGWPKNVSILIGFVYFFMLGREFAFERRG